MSTDETRATLAKLVTATVSAKASDLHLRAGAPPFVRVDGRLARTNIPPLTAAQIEEFISTTSARNLPDVNRDNWEYSFEQTGVARFRGHVFRENDSWAVTLRVVPLTVPTFQELRLPPVVKTLSENQPGLVLVTGATGCGKSTTTASMLRHLAATETVHVVTIEDPVEYRISDVPSCISQRELGRDTKSYSDALKAAMREDPDVLFVGEIRDLDALDVALQAAESGHAVYSTFHTGSSVKTLQRLVAMYAGTDQTSIRGRLADSLRGILCQRLLPRKGTRGRVLCTEVLINNYAVKDAIRDPARMATIQAILERSADQHMHTFDQNLVALVREGLITPEVALNSATAPNDLRRLLSLHGA